MTPVVPLNHRYLYQNQLTTLDAGLTLPHSPPVQLRSHSASRQRRSPPLRPVSSSKTWPLASSGTSDYCLTRARSLRRCLFEICPSVSVPHLLVSLLLSAPICSIQSHDLPHYRGSPIGRLSASSRPNYASTACRHWRAPRGHR